MKVNRNRHVAGAVRYVCVRFVAFLIIAGYGMGLMYCADNFRHLVAVGLVYLIAMGAIIIVVMADQFDHEVLKRLRKKT